MKHALRVIMLAALVTTTSASAIDIREQQIERQIGDLVALVESNALDDAGRLTRQLVLPHAETWFKAHLGETAGEAAAARYAAFGEFTSSGRAVRDLQQATREGFRIVDIERARTVGGDSIFRVSLASTAGGKDFELGDFAFVDDRLRYVGNVR